MNSELYTPAPAQVEPLETVLARAMAHWYFGESCDETLFDNADIDTADSLMLALNGHNLRSLRP